MGTSTGRLGDSVPGHLQGQIMGRFKDFRGTSAKQVFSFRFQAHQTYFDRLVKI